MRPVEKQSDGSLEGVHDPVVLWSVWQNVLAGWLCTRTLARELRASQLFSHIGERYAEVMLFDLRPLAPFARRGIQGSVVAIGLLSSLGQAILERTLGSYLP